MNADYMGKAVYIGIDVHKKSYVIYCISDGERVKNWSMESNPEGLIEQLKKSFPGGELETVYEAGFSGYALHRKLKASGIKNIVVNPGSLEMASRDRVKTDKRDAKKLAEQLSMKRLTSIHIPSEEEENLRLYTRLRATLVKDRGRIASRIKSKLYQFGHDNELLEDDSVATSSWIKRVKAYEGYSKELKYVIGYLCDQWLKFTEDLKEITKKISEQSKENTKSLAQESIYKSVPGIGDISAKELSRELGTLEQFKNNKQAYSYVGLTPSESSSGEHRRQGGISHCGRPRLRHILIEVAWRSVMKDAQLAEKFHHLSYRRGKKRAIVAIARILIGRIRACFEKGMLSGSLLNKGFMFIWIRNLVKSSKR